MKTLRLPTTDGRLEAYRVSGEVPPGPPVAAIRRRSVFAAAHVVADPLATSTPDGPAALDWDATLAFRHHLWSCGMGVAEAMDTAQRGAGLDWATARELVTRTAAEALSVGGRVVAGVTTDQLPADAPADLNAVTHAYEEQLAAVESAGAQAAIMPSRQLAACARGSDDYLKVYGSVLAQAGSPVVLHWLGPAFDPLLAGYWGSDDVDVASETVLELCRAHGDSIDGIKLSLLDEQLEVGLRRRLPHGTRLYTGDDFNFPSLVRGDTQGYSDALLGVFDPLAPLASYALGCLDAGDADAFSGALSPTIGFARHLFGAPTRHYKTGVTFLAWLNGHQAHPRMLAGAESARSVPHLATLFRLADEARALQDPELGVRRMRAFLELAGVEQSP